MHRQIPESETSPVFDFGDGAPVESPDVSSAGVFSIVWQNTGSYWKLLQDR